MFAADEDGTAANGQHKLWGVRLGYADGPLVVSAAYDETKNDITDSKDFKDGVIAASYDFGIVKLSGAWRRFKFSDSKQTNMLLAAILPVGVGQVKLSYQKADVEGAVETDDLSDNDGSQLGLGYVHSLSKRTVLYSTYSRISNSGVATFTVPGGDSGMTAGGTSWGLEAGIRHNF